MPGGGDSNRGTKPATDLFTGDQTEEPPSHPVPSRAPAGLPSALPSGLGKQRALAWDVAYLSALRLDIRSVCSAARDEWDSSGG